LITGPTGTGKTWVACALGHQACREGYRTIYYYAPKLFRALETAQADGSLPALLKRLARASLLIVDDLGISSVSGKLYRQLLEILDDRQGHGATLITSQFPVAQWHDVIADPTVADAILDRLVHNAYRLQLGGKSMREPKNPSDRQS
jgi:DNA replication protein DnaC